MTAVSEGPREVLASDNNSPSLIQLLQDDPEVQHRAQLEKLLGEFATNVSDAELRQRIENEARRLYSAAREEMESSARVNRNYIPLFAYNSARQQLLERYPLQPKPVQPAVAQQADVSSRANSSYFLRIIGAPVRLVRYLFGNSGNYMTKPQVQEAGEK